MATSYALAGGASGVVVGPTTRLVGSRHKEVHWLVPCGTTRGYVPVCMRLPPAVPARQVSVARHGDAFVTVAAASAPTTPDPVPVQEYHTVGDAMTRGGLIAAKLTTTVDEALEALVENRITGMPVVDDSGRLIGVVSDYDLLALDTISGDRVDDKSMFPAPNTNWKAFKEIQKLMGKTRGKTVGDVMTPHPLVVRPSTNLEDAARLLLESKYRRLPVVDDNRRLVGILTRGNVVKAALDARRAADVKAGKGHEKGNGLFEEI